jgi:hypothetical protein
MTKGYVNPIERMLSRKFHHDNPNRELWQEIEDACEETTEEQDKQYQADLVKERRQQQTIEMKVRKGEGCHMFRCLKCWYYILPEDSVVEYNDGYAHKLCTQKLKATA